MNVWRGIASIASVTPLLAIVFQLESSAPATAKETWRVTDIAPSARIHLRQEAHNRSKVIAYIPGDARGLSRGPCDDGWCQVEYQGLKGWMFARYLTRDEQPPQETAAAALTSAQINALATRKTLQLAKRDGSPLAIYAFPNERLPVAGSLPPAVETVQGLGSCIRDWCYVRSGELIGWLRAEAFAAEEAATEPATAAALAVSMTSDESKALNKTEPTATHAIVQAAATLPALGDLGTKSYTLAGLGGQSALAMREQPDGTSRILAWIPNGATDVEGLRKCVEKWCLVRHATVSGWVARRHLADVSVETSQTFQAKGVELWGTLDVLDYPNAHANIVGKIPSYATGIVPIGGCDDDWCHVRYLGIAGWVSGQYLEPQAH
jgi:SH3-like domain-containing protein